MVTEDSGDIDGEILSVGRVQANVGDESAIGAIFTYGSPHVNLVADSTVPGGLDTRGYDDECVPSKRWDIVKDGLFVGYGTSRQWAGTIDEGRSRECDVPPREIPPRVAGAVEGRRPAEALRRAQGELRDETEWRSPAFWAGFVAVGDWSVEGAG